MLTFLLVLRYRTHILCPRFLGWSPQAFIQTSYLLVFYMFSCFIYGQESWNLWLLVLSSVFNRIIQYSNTTHSLSLNYQKKKKITYQISLSLSLSHTHTHIYIFKERIYTANNKITLFGFHYFGYQSILTQILKSHAL